MGNVSSAIQNCLSSAPDEDNSSESGSRIVFRPKKQKFPETTPDGETDTLKTPDNDSKQKPHYHFSLEDFEIVRTLGKGSFGKVYLVQKKASKKYYALKALKKKDLILKNLLKCTLNEKNILKEMQHPFIVNLKYSFQSKTNVYMVMDYCPGGDLYAYSKKFGKIDEKTVKICAAEVILALEYLHETLNIIHRDIKADNVIIDADGHVKFTDFGLAKSTRKALTLCGTPEYLAPEIVTGRAYGHEVDWWSVGCLIYQLLEAQPPFTNERKDKLIQNILTESPHMPASFSNSLKDLLTKLLDKNPKQRLGAKGAQEIKKHPFFKGLDWKALMAKEIPAPFRTVTPTPDTPPHHHKTTSTGSVLEPPVESQADNCDFPQFTYAARDALTDDADGQVKS